MLQAKSKTWTVADITRDGDIEISSLGDGGYRFTYSYDYMDVAGERVEKPGVQRTSVPLSASEIPKGVAEALGTVQTFIYKQALMKEEMIDDGIKE